MNFPNRDELSFLAVLALPNASSIGLEANICDSIEGRFPLEAYFFSCVKYLIMCLAASVLPDPLSPLMMTVEAVAVVYPRKIELYAI
jgi:hypothetical protein